MAIATQDITIPLAPVADNGMVGGQMAGYWPLPNRRYNRADYGFAARRFYDDTWAGGTSPSKKFVFYFHGSGSTSPLPTTSTGIVATLIAAGYEVIQPMYYGAWNSPESPFRYGYGNVNAPAFMSLFIKTAIWPEAAYKWALANLASDAAFMFLGHSMGASACASWASNFMGRAERSSLDARFRGMVINGATVGGLGDYSWNDVMRNLNTLTNMFYGLKTRAIITYGDEDAYCPPDYSRRIQAVLRPDREVYMVSPGAKGHGWMSDGTVESQNFVLQWVQQILDIATVTDRFGNAAVRGPAMGEAVVTGDLPWVLASGIWDNEGYWRTDREWI